MSNMFAGCSTLRTLSLSKLNTSSVTDMSFMFSKCSLLSELNLSQFDTSRVTTMSSMFADCSSLRTVHLSSFDTSHVSSMDKMFSGCLALNGLDLSGFNTSSVTDMSSMFEKCEVLEKLDLSLFNTGNVGQMSKMFAGCKVLTEINVSGFNTTHVTDMSYMFSDCPALASLNLQSFKLGSVRNMTRMFSGCTALKNLTIYFTGNGAQEAEYMFSECTSLEKLDVPGIINSSMTKASGMFWRCASLKKLILNDCNTSNVLYMEYMFYGCTALKALNLSSFSTGRVSSSQDMFDPSLESITIGRDFTLQKALPDGQWRNENGTEFAAADIPRNTPGTYIRVTDDADESNPSSTVVMSIAIDPMSKTVGEKTKPFMLTAKITPASAAQSNKVSWTSSDENVATVDGGMVTPHNAGMATITASAGGKSTTCQVTVQSPQAVVMTPAGSGTVGSVVITDDIGVSQEVLSGLSLYIGKILHPESGRLATYFEDKVNAGCKIADMYDIHFLDANSNIVPVQQSPTPMSVHIEMDEETQQLASTMDMNIYYVADDGTTTKMDTWHESAGKVSFETNHFSNYVLLAEPKASSGSNDDGSDSGQSGNDAGLNQTGTAQQGAASSTVSGDPSVTGKTGLSQTGDDRMAGGVAAAVSAVLALAGAAFIFFGMRRMRKE